jgi:hypothetical protein
VAACQDTRQYELEAVALADDGALDLREDGAGAVRDVVEGEGRCGH